MKIPARPDEARDGWSGERNFKVKVPLGEPSPINLQTTRSSSVSTVALSRGFGLFSFIPPLFDSLKNVRVRGDAGNRTTMEIVQTGWVFILVWTHRVGYSPDLWLTPTLYSGATVGVLGQDAGRAPGPI